MERYDQGVYVATLDILIPTYNRPESTCHAISSILNCTDPRVNVLCNSNGFEPTLQQFCNGKRRVVYSFFSKNLGAASNFSYLLQSSRARFCMLLSDEDRIEPRGLVTLLDFLDSLCNRVSVVSCSVLDSETGKFYYDPHWLLRDKLVDLDQEAAIGSIPTYMSGLIFSVEKMSDIAVDKVFTPTIGNAYPHLDLSLLLLRNGLLAYFSQRCVLKGAEVLFGGDGYSHRLVVKGAKAPERDLNPEIYSSYARVCQFLYRDQFASSLKPSLCRGSYLILKVRLLLFFVRAAREATRFVSVPEGFSPQDEVRRAFEDSGRERFYIKTKTSRVFSVVVTNSFFTQPWFIKLAFLLLKLSKIFFFVTGKSKDP